MLLGAALLVLATWSWVGRTARARWWTQVWQGDSLALGVAPAMGLILCGLGLIALVPGEATGSALGTVGGLFWLLGFPVMLIGVWTPRWWGPGWYRQMSDRERAAALRGPAGAFVRAAHSPRPAKSAAVADRGRGHAAIGRWSAGWVRDPDTDTRDHALSRRGTVQGRLTVYPDAITFAASPTEDRLRLDPVVLSLDRAEVTGARVVPARAGADGQARRGRVYRSPFRRLVLHTRSETHVFEVSYGRAPAVLSTLQDAWGDTLEVSAR